MIDNIDVVVNLSKADFVFIKASKKTLARYLIVIEVCSRIGVLYYQRIGVQKHTFYSFFVGVNADCVGCKLAFLLPKHRSVQKVCHAVFHLVANKITNRLHIVAKHLHMTISQDLLSLVRLVKIDPQCIRMQKQGVCSVNLLHKNFICQKGIFETVFSVGLQII